MIQIKDTKNMIGITIHGDYEDLQTLYKALGNYLRFYFDHQEDSGAYACYETILGLCYDIRHTFQGDRNIESVHNNYENIAQLSSSIYEHSAMDKNAIQKERRKYKNGNLYFNGEVLYPWAIYYLFALQAISEDVYRHEWFENDELGYTEYQAESDLALIRYFVHLLWAKVREHFPEEVMQVLWSQTRICNHVEYYFDISDLYMEWLCTYWVNGFKDKADRHEALPLICLELSSILDEYEEDLEAIIAEADEQKKSVSGNTEDTESVDNSMDESIADKQAEFRRKLIHIQASIAQTTLRGLNIYDQYILKYCDQTSDLKQYYLNQDEFESVIFIYVREHGGLTEEDYEQWLDQRCGEVDWEQLEW